MIPLSDHDRRNAARRNIRVAVGTIGSGLRGHPRTSVPGRSRHSQDAQVRPVGCPLGRRGRRHHGVAGNRHRLQPRGLGIPLREGDYSAFERQLLAAILQAAAGNCGIELGEFPGHAEDAQLLTQGSRRRSEGPGRTDGPQVDVNENVYTQSSLARRQEAVNRLETSLWIN